MDNMIFTSEVCGVVLIAPFDKISRPPCSTIRFIVFLSLFFRCFSPFSLYHRIFSLTIPMMLYVILIMVVLGSGLHSIILAMGLTYWVGMVRIVRSQVLTMREQEFVSAAVLLGVPTRKILVRHLIPNAMGPIMVALTMQIPSAMFTEAFLSFIGLGVSKPQASWGALANAALPSLYTSPYQLFYPALIMSITILALNLFSDGLRDSLDPRLRK